LFGGDLNADGISDLMLADSDHYTILFGQVGGTYGEGETIVVQTDYLTTAVTDIGGDGTDEILAVGGVGIWGFPSTICRLPRFATRCSIPPPRQR
jgi:hypothetical protein